MSYRDVLIDLIRRGVPMADIYTHFRLERHLSRPAIIAMLHDCGVSIPIPPSEDEISDQRRRELQDISLT
jgi:hypothetical protein